MIVVDNVIAYIIRMEESTMPYFIKLCIRKLSTKLYQNLFMTQITESLFVDEDSLASIQEF